MKPLPLPQIYVYMVMHKRFPEFCLYTLCPECMHTKQCVFSALYGHEQTIKAIELMKQDIINNPEKYMEVLL